ncbi:peptide deformylase [Halobacteriovorax sp. GB3]|uniref:peptide deformylase n=1 Tax=Halobacteriovorax sp. GB3 TaxID=2719615 RepID=UPI00235E0080|nr:peptide deformylase [Halobacteriovorax sp. GB3]MDD0854761.1 peptide deformylase [Halobacteriovorax sp. GB3]
MDAKTNFLQNYELEGERLKIFTLPAPVLKKVAEPVTEFNDELKQLAKDMLFTMYKAPGVGLAAPQVGKSIRMFVVDIDYNREETTLADGSTDYILSEFNPQVYINPVFKEKDGEVVCEEGCLSVPGIYEEVKRAEHIVLEWQDLEGNTHSQEFEGFRAVCLQHENDHLDGIVFLDRLSLLKKNLLTKKFLKTKKKKGL